MSNYYKYIKNFYSLIKNIRSKTQIHDINYFKYSFRSNCYNYISFVTLERFTN